MGGTARQGVWGLMVGGLMRGWGAVASGGGSGWRGGGAWLGPDRVCNIG